MDELARRALLFDFYSSLLTEKQREIYDLYYLQDLSLGEIAEIQKVSRPAVYDLIHRTEEILNKYEEKLLLVKKYHITKRTIQDLRTLLKGISITHPQTKIESEILIDELEDCW